MTKEQAIKILTGYMGGKIDPESTEFYHAIESVVDILESQPSITSNLDEAAEMGWDAYYNSDRFPSKPCAQSGYKTGFKAGAEWMVKQGVTVNGSIEEISDGAYKTIDIFAQELDDVWTDGDCDVIIQIRKK